MYSLRTSFVAVAVSAMMGVLAKSLSQPRQPSVGWPEVMAPRGDAMSLIYGKQAKIAAGVGCLQDTEQSAARTHCEAVACC